MAPTSDQKTEWITQLLVEEIVPQFGVPEALLSDRRTNLLSILMQDVCKLLGMKKTNTLHSSSPKCDGMIETYHSKQYCKNMQAAKYLPGALWAYRNTPHSYFHWRETLVLFSYVWLPLTN